jgi:hypothetical protein
MKNYKKSIVHKMNLLISIIRRILSDLLLTQLIHLADQSQSHKV